MSQRHLCDSAFAQWAQKPDVQLAARAYIAEILEGQEENLHILENVLGHRVANFRVINAMNQLFWAAEARLDLAGVGCGRADFNQLATQEEPHWRMVFPIFAYALGFR